MFLRSLIAGLSVPRNGRGTTKTGPRLGKMGPRWAKMQPRHEKMSPRNVAIAGRFAVSANLEQFRGQRRANDVLMKQVFVRGRTDRREKEATCGHCRSPKSVRVAETDAKVMRNGSRSYPKWIQELVKIRLPGPKGSPCECIEVTT